MPALQDQASGHNGRGAFGRRALEPLGRLFALPLILGSLIMAGPARAGDIALLESLGFSEAGDVFAFQQSGVEDGSGFPYAEIFFLDLKSDRFLEPSPIRVRLNEDGALVADAVAEARAAAADLLSRTMPDKRNGHVVLDNPPTDLSSDGKAARFVARPVLPPIDEPVELRMETFPLEGPEICQDIGRPVMGYRIVKLALEPGQKASVLHEDTAIPTSRGCPLDYAIRQVRVYEKPGGGFAAVSLIAVQSHGFEGPDIRYIANPVPMPVPR